MSPVPKVPANTSHRLYFPDFSLPATPFLALRLLTFYLGIYCVIHRYVVTAIQNIRPVNGCIDVANAMIFVEVYISPLDFRQRFESKRNHIF